jgi:hypothetical protein
LPECGISRTARSCDLAGATLACARADSNALVYELVTIFGVTGFASPEVNIKVRVLDAYTLLLRALEVHLDPRLNKIPKRAMTEASGVKVSS